MCIIVWTGTFRAFALKILFKVVFIWCYLQINLFRIENPYCYGLNISWPQVQHLKKITLRRPRRAGASGRWKPTIVYGKRDTIFKTKWLKTFFKQKWNIFYSSYLTFKMWWGCFCYPLFEENNGNLLIQMRER